MAKRKSNKKTGKEFSKKTRDKGAAKSAAKKPAAHKPADDKDNAIIESPSDIEHPLEQIDGTQTDKPADGSKEVDVGKSYTETPTGKGEDSQKDDQSRGVTEVILEAVSKEEGPSDEVGNLQTEEQTGSATGAVVDGPDAEGNLTESGGDTQADRLVDDAPESVVEGSVTTESTTEETDAFQTDKQAEDSIEEGVEGSDTEVHAGKVEVPQADDQTVEITEAILEAAAETERLAEEAESLQAEDEQTSIVVDAEDAGSAENLRQEAEDTQTGKLTDDVSDSVVENSVAAESPTEKIDDTETGDRPEDVNEALIEDPDTIESRIEKADDTQTDSQSQAGDVIDVTAEAERPAEEAESLQAEDEQTGFVVDAEDTESAESLSLKTEDTQTDKLADDVSESVVEDPVAAESSTEKIDDTRTDVQSEDVIETAAEGQTVVDRIKKFFSGIFRIGSKTDDSAEDGIESSETVANHAGKADDARTDNQAVFPTKANVEGSDNEIQSSVYSDIKPYLTKKTGIIISVSIMIAAVILLIVASIERRSAKKSLVQFSKVAESIKQMQEQTLKDREQVTQSQIESRELIIDTLSLTRNGLELERANTDEVEVKRIIGVFINDIDERITKIKADIALLKNKLKETG